jgi:flagellar FliL protein
LEVLLMAEVKGKVESKPMVENKPVVESKGRSRILLILIGLAVIIALGGATFFAVPYVKGKRAGKKSVPPPEQVKATMSLEPFLVNLADKQEVRFLKTTFQLGLADEPKEEAKKEVVVAAIRDSIISLLTAKTADEILSPQGKDKLREEVRSRVRSVAPGMKVLEVYIVDFVVQL